MFLCANEGIHSVVRRVLFLTAVKIDAKLVLVTVGTPQEGIRASYDGTASHSYSSVWLLMSPLTKTVYTLRYVPAKGGDSGEVGGMYATNAGIDKPIAIKADEPSVSRQRWLLMGQPEDNQWGIVGLEVTGDQKVVPHGESNSLFYGFGNAEVTESEPNPPVELLGKNAIAYELNKLEGNEIYSIHPTNVVTKIGVTFCIGVSDQGTLEIQAFPVESGIPLPGWQLTKVDLLNSVKVRVVVLHNVTITLRWYYDTKFATLEGFLSYIDFKQMVFISRLYNINQEVIGMVIAVVLEAAGVSEPSAAAARLS
ncbi:hypothetical protein BDV93DRAFT_577505 [Ceratobasidium sp. AG-I]|nr:hypothetical protein BDV93DRAFT_577505 [Ceratobasidium sp. AG-I]